jgi:carbamoyltransferase
MHSIGGMYNAASTYVFNGFEDPGKLMGLAPFGRPGQHGFEIFSLKDGRVFVNYDWMASMKNPCRTPALFDDSFQEYADFAFHVQKEVERALLYLFEKRLARVPCRNVAYAGGVALNAVANWRLQQIADTERFYVQPAAGDNGLAIGCAYYGWLEVLKRPRRMHTGSTCFGRHYPDASIDKALNTRNSEIEIHRANDVTEAAAAHLNQGRTVAWFQGGSEFGPRALGNRSILADPRLPRMHSRINRQIKFREDFRPFAPSVPLDDVSTYFDCETESPYMLLVAPVRKEWADKIPAVVHRDGSARIQTVTEESNPRYYKLLKEFKSAAGLSILLNTSFNKKGMPIVETPEEALSFYLECALDVLVIGNYIVTKAQILPAKPGGAIPELIHARLKRKPAESRALGGMYQINVVGVESWTMDLNLPDPAVTPGAARCPDVVVEARAHDLAAILTGKPADSLELVRSGKLQLKGNAARAQTLMRLLFS